MTQAECTKNSFIYGNQEIEFEIQYSDRKTIEINVYPDTQVAVKAPCDKTFDEVLQRVKKKAHWIVKQKSYFNSFKPVLPDKKYFSGETHRYLGRQYRLKFIKSTEKQVKLKNGYINVYTPDKKDTETIKVQLEEWYFNHAKVKFQDRLDICFEKVRKYGIENKPKVQVRKMTKRWGSCTSDSRIIFNLDLIKAPSHCIDYVVMHELCHLKHRNHNAEFFTLLYQIMPDWEYRKEKLEKIVFS